MISLQSFAVLAHEASCYESDECVYINTSSDDAGSEYEYFRTIIQDLKLPQSTAAEKSKYLLKDYELTQAGYDLLAAHNLHFTQENHG